MDAAEKLARTVTVLPDCIIKISEAVKAVVLVGEPDGLTDQVPAVAKVPLALE